MLLVDCYNIKGDRNISPSETVDSGYTFRSVSRISGRHKQTGDYFRRKGANEEGETIERRTN